MKAELKEDELMREKYFDGHIHSRNSDGAFSVSEIIRMVSLQGTHSAIAITDHNMFSLRAPLKTGELSVLPGCEFDCSYISPDQSAHNIHMIGIFFDEVPVIVEQQLLKDHSEELKEYAKAVIAGLREYGFSISYENVFQEHPESINKPKFAIADYMVSHEMVHDLREAFTRYVGGEAEQAVNILDYVSYPSLREAQDIVLSHSGAAVLCHPLSTRYRLTDTELENMIRDFSLWAEGRAAAIEVYYSKHTPEQVRMLQTLAAKYHLLSSVGSDFHNTNTAFIHGSMDILRDMERRIAEFKAKKQTT